MAWWKKGCLTVVFASEPMTLGRGDHDGSPKANPSRNAPLVVWSVILAVGLLLIESVYLYCKHGSFFGALGVWVVPLVGAYISVALFLAFAIGTRTSIWYAFVLVAAVFYGIESAKMFVISAPLLGSPVALGGFVLLSFLIFLGLFVIAKRLQLDPSILYWFVWVYSASCYAAAFQWRTAGGSLAAFLRSPFVLMTAATGALGLIIVVWVSRRARRSLIGGMALLAVAIALLVGMAGQASVALSSESSADATLPDVYIASFDALGRDVFELYCVRSNGAAATICSRGLRFQNVVADGLATYEILRANTFGGLPQSRCETSLPGLAAARGYETSMWIGRKGVRIEGADCYRHYFSGRGIDIMTRFAVPAVAEHVWSALFRGGADSREEFVDTSVLLSELDARLSPEHPQFAYLHFLDLHAPYEPSSALESDEHEQKMKEFMESCYRAGCDLAANKSLIAYARSAFARSLPDIDRHLGQLLKIAESRRRPYMIVLTADHGELFGEHNGFGHTGGFVSELLSIPFVVYDSRYDYRAREDCSLASSSHALHGLVEHVLAAAGPIRPGELFSAKSTLEIRDSLGVATLDAPNEEIRFRINEGMLKQAGTSRNIHLEPEGRLPFPLHQCGTATQRNASE